MEGLDYGGVLWRGLTVEGHDICGATLNGQKF